MNRFYPRADVEGLLVPHIKFFKENVVTFEKKQMLQRNVDCMREAIDNLGNGVVELFKRLEEITQFLLFCDMMGTHKISHHGFSCKQLIINVNGDRWGIILGKRKSTTSAGQFQLKYFISLSKDAEEQLRLPGTPNGVQLSDDPAEPSLNRKIFYLNEDVYEIEVDKATVGDIQNILRDARNIREKLDLAADVISQAIQYCDNELVKLTKSYDDLLTTDVGCFNQIK